MAGIAAPPGRRPPPPLARGETRLAALDVETPHGPIWCVRAHDGPERRHGAARIGTALETWDAAGLALAARAPGAAALAPGDWLFLDVETTGLGTGAGVVAFLVGLAWLAPDGLHIEQYLLRDAGEEQALLHAVAVRFAAFAGLATFNGRTFDLPLLRMRAALARRLALGEPALHCDVLGIARRLWDHRTPDRRLATLERHLLGHARRGDLPGVRVPDLYLAYLRNGRPEVLDPILAHNRADLRALVLVTHAAAGFVAAARAGAHATPQQIAADRVRAARLLESAGEPEAARALLIDCLAGAPEARTRAGALVHLGRIEKRQRRYDAAAAAWEAALACDPGDVALHEDLARLHEHRRRDPAAALARVERGLAVDPEDLHLLYRRARLLRRLQGSASGGIPAASQFDLAGGLRTC